MLITLIKKINVDIRNSNLEDNGVDSVLMDSVLKLNEKIRIPK